MNCSKSNMTFAGIDIYRMRFVAPIKFGTNEISCLGIYWMIELQIYTEDVRTIFIGHVKRISGRVSNRSSAKQRQKQFAPFSAQPRSKH